MCKTKMIGTSSSFPWMKQTLSFTVSRTERLAPKIASICFQRHCSRPGDLGEKRVKQRKIWLLKPLASKHTLEIPVTVNTFWNFILLNFCLMYNFKRWYSFSMLLIIILTACLQNNTKCTHASHSYDQLFIVYSSHLATFVSCFSIAKCPKFWP